MVGKRQLIGNIDNIASYTVLHDSADVLRRGLLGPNIIKRVSLIHEETKNYAHRHLKTMGEDINLAFHARVVIERVAIEVAELGCVLF